MRAKRCGNQAVVLRIDSPGGSVLASEEIYREVEAFRAAGKPVIVSMGELAASGGYYIAAGADEIIASAMTITGSIGVFAALPTLDRTLGRVGVQVDGVGTTALSGSMRVDRPLKPEIESILQAGVDHSYAEFLQRVASVATAPWRRSMLSRRAGSGPAAMRSASGWSTGSARPRTRCTRRRSARDSASRTTCASSSRISSSTDQLLVNMRSSALQVLRGLGYRDAGASALATQLGPQLKPLQRELLRWQRLAATPGRTLAYCLCGAD